MSGQTLFPADRATEIIARFSVLSSLWVIATFIDSVRPSVRYPLVTNHHSAVISERERTDAIVRVAQKDINKAKERELEREREKERERERESKR
jgi:hypothetical protein